MADPVVRVLDFEGPLDLLIHLIEKNKMDIYDIPIVSITDQYISYLHSFTETDLEAASQFLVMASLLLQIKSRMLLPKTELEDEDEADPRDMLVQMLLEYRCIKAVAKQLETMKQTAARQHTRKPFFAGGKLRNLHAYPVSDLLLALAGLTGPLRQQMAVVERQEYDVGTKMQEIIRLLGEYPEGIEFEKAFVKSGSASEKVASFLAVLELLRLKVVRISQSQAFAPIYLFLRTVPEPVLIGGEPDAAGV
ncbi:MAG: segregation/condensation protein A [Acidaminococcaceae bacterium]|nr:segregation/condensation protein A [Acidaminococcaceae bacterium]